MVIKNSKTKKNVIKKSNIKKTSLMGGKDKKTQKKLKISPLTPSKTKTKKEKKVIKSKKVQKKIKPKKTNTKDKSQKKKISLKKKQKFPQKASLINKKKKITKKTKKKVEIKENKTSLIPKVKLIKPNHNPIISPSFYPWESKATFNPAAVVSNGKVHLLYRAIGDDDSSVLGYASSFDGLHIEERPTYCAYKRPANKPDKKGPSIDYISGGGWSGGCEDPRLSLIDDTLYMIYTAFDGWSSVRIALTSIPFDDFKKKKWNWKKPVLISPPKEINKNWVLFPEKINGKFAIIHSITPEILIEYVDDLNEFDGERFIKSFYHNKPKWQHSWDNMVRGVGPTPIKTKLGWLILYHSMDRNDPNRYKLGAMILDEKDPTKILYKLSNPILEPEEDYENNGIAWGVVYSCGAIIKEDELFVYYGGADKFVCVASMPIDELLEDLKKDKIAKFKKKRVLKKSK